MTLQEALPPADGEDRALLARLRAGDGKAFEVLVRGHGGRMLTVARRLLRNEEDARDAVQNALLSAFRNVGRFEGQAQLGTWLHRIVVNAALMKLRGQRRRPEASIEELLPRFRGDGHHEGPVLEWSRRGDDEVARRERRALVRRSIDRLPDSFRVVLLLRDIEELDTGETARLLGISETAVKVRLHRARQALRTLLDPHFRRGEAS
jgi:RNA polymerase sigma-70 factor (ECF subfamily)